MKYKGEDGLRQSLYRVPFQKCCYTLPHRRMHEASVLAFWSINFKNIEE